MRSWSCSSWRNCIHRPHCCQSPICECFPVGICRGNRNIGKLEATGAQNFLDLDDIPVCDEGEFIDSRSILSLPLANQRCVLPPFERSPDDPFLLLLSVNARSRQEAKAATALLVILGVDTLDGNGQSGGLFLQSE